MCVKYNETNSDFAQVYKTKRKTIFLKKNFLICFFFLLTVVTNLYININFNKKLNDKNKNKN